MKCMKEPLLLFAEVTQLCQRSTYEVSMSARPTRSNHRLSRGLPCRCYSFLRHATPPNPPRSASTPLDFFECIERRPRLQQRTSRSGFWIAVRWIWIIAPTSRKLIEYHPLHLGRRVRRRWRVRRGAEGRKVHDPCAILPVAAGVRERVAT